jgi:hypothetical protein
VCERELRSEIIQSGVWRYDNSVPTDVGVVKQNFEYWYEPGFSDTPEQLNENGEAFQVVFARADRRIVGPAKMSLEAAIEAAETTISGKVDWTNHIIERLFGG